VSASGYRIVKLANGSHSVHSLAHHETFHPVVGPMVEAESLYLRQLRLVDRFQNDPEDFVVWDVGLGAAANVVTVLEGLKSLTGRLRIVSFDHTSEPLKFALDHVQELGYLAGYEDPAGTLLHQNQVSFKIGGLTVDWQLHLADFPALIESEPARRLPKPHAIMFDAFSPAKNPAMWTLPLFSQLFRLLDPNRPCSLPTYSRSTILRVTLLLAGFYVGVGHRTGEKEETTIAANTLALIEEPLDARWFDRVKRSGSAEPLHTPNYRQEPLSPAAWAKLQLHPQFPK